MGLLNKIFGQTDVVTNGVVAMGDAFDKVFTSDEERLKAQIVIEELKQKPHVMQALANNLAANHTSWFVAGGRPSFLWAGSISFLFVVIGGSLGLEIPEYIVDLVKAVSLGSLGLYGTMRSAEKVTKILKK